MTFSVDDLVSSFSSNHVGQEAIDLALLQNQLAQTLSEGTTFSQNAYNGGHTIVFPPRGRVVQPCTTPIARTPSLSANPGWCVVTDMSRSRRNSVTSAYLEDSMDVDITIPVDSLRSHTNILSSAFMDDIEQDERSVEDLLIPSPPLSAPLSGSQLANTFLPSTPQKPSKLPDVDQMHPSPVTSPDISPSSPIQAGSIFTSTDPFYIAQLQSLNNAGHPQSLFAQNGRLPQNSPFALREHLHSHAQSTRT